MTFRPLTAGRGRRHDVDAVVAVRGRYMMKALPEARLRVRAVHAAYLQHSLLKATVRDMGYPAVHRLWDMGAGRRA